MFGEVARTAYDLNFRLFGIPVRIHPLFWVIAFIFSPFLSMNIGDLRLWFTGLAGWMAAWLVSFIIHEFGHAIVIKKVFGADPWIVFYGFGGMACHNPYYRRKPGPWGRMLIAFAGPGAEILGVAILLGLAALFGCHFLVQNDSLGIIPIPIILPVELVMGMSGESALYRYFLAWFVYSFVWMGLFWSILNLVPIYPLDGGHIMQNFLLVFDPRNGHTTAIWISIICAGGFAVILLKNGSTFAAMFFAFLAFQNWQMLRFRPYP